nr:hypothetical protein [Ferrimicrobium acidiphilum]
MAFRFVDSGAPVAKNNWRTTSSLVQSVCRLGPSINSIARDLGENKETLRYHYRRYILGNKMSVHAFPDYGKLGLARAVVVAVFPLEAPSDVGLKTLFNEIAEKNYIMGFERVIQHGYSLPAKEWLFSLAYPAGGEGELSYFMDRLVRTGALRRVSLHAFDWFDVHVMKADYYDFSKNAWNYHFDTEGRPDIAEARQEPHARCEFDSVDLQIVKALQSDANINLSDIQILGTGYKSLTWHFREHVLKRGLLAGYRVNWLRSGYNQAAGIASNHKFRYERVDLLVKNTSMSEKGELASWAHKTPFLWSEATGIDYYAKFAVPVELANEFNELLRTMTERVRGRASIMLMDQESAFSYAINPRLYLSEKGEWAFDGRKLEAAASKVNLTFNPERYASV